MTIRTRRRQTDGNDLGSMSDDQLEEIRFFGTLLADPETIVYQATREEQERAAELLRTRRAEP